VIEEGELEQVAGCTRLSIAFAAPVTGWLLPWAWERRLNAELRALKEVCEGREPEAPRGPLAELQWWRWAIWAGLGLSLGALSGADSQGASLWVPLLLMLMMMGLLFPRWSRYFSRLLAIG
jgi:hypothetical protein